jgi:hypothetical protein
MGEGKKEQLADSDAAFGTISKIVSVSKEARGNIVFNFFLNKTRVKI